MIEVGSVCIKTAGKESGLYCTVVKKIDKSFVLVSGPKLLTGVKRRKCNLQHLKETQYKVEIKEGASDEEVIEALKKANLVRKLGLKLPPAAKLKEMKEIKQRKK